MTRITGKTLQPTFTTLLFAVVALVMSGCATNPQKSGGFGPQHSEVCVATDEREIAALFDRWNNSLRTGDVHKVVANYATKSVLLATVSNKPRLTPEEKEDYFHHFLENKPSGQIDWRSIKIDCTSAVDVGLYTFTFARTGEQVKARYTFTYRWDGKQWLITSHHSSAMPEK
jgi:uncharacterized protein (TIGR02246 family)